MTTRIGPVSMLPLVLGTFGVRMEMECTKCFRSLRTRFTPPGASGLTEQKISEHFFVNLKKYMCTEINCLSMKMKTLKNHVKYEARFSRNMYHKMILFC